MTQVNGLGHGEQGADAAQRAMHFFSTFNPDSLNPQSEQTLLNYLEMARRNPAIRAVVRNNKNRIFRAVNRIYAQAQRPGLNPAARTALLRKSGSIFQKLLALQEGSNNSVYYAAAAKNIILQNFPESIKNGSAEARINYINFMLQTAFPGSTQTAVERRETMAHELMTSLYGRGYGILTFGDNGLIASYNGVSGSQSAGSAESAEKDPPNGYGATELANIITGRSLDSDRQQPEEDTETTRPNNLGLTPLELENIGNHNISEFIRANSDEQNAARPTTPEERERVAQMNAQLQNILNQGRSRTPDVSQEE